MTTLGVRSKAIFSSLAASKLKRRIEKEDLKRQCGAKPAGAEAIAHAFQQAIAQNPDYDAFSADAVCTVVASLTRAHHSEHTIASTIQHHHHIEHGTDIPPLEIFIKVQVTNYWVFCYKATSLSIY